MKVRFTDRALDELLSQIRWLARRSPTAARAARNSIYETLTWLADFPRAAPVVDDVHRDVAVRFGRDGLVIRYRLEREDLIVVRIFHGRQAR